MEFPPGGSQFARDSLHISRGCWQVPILEDSGGEDDWVWSRSGSWEATQRLREGRCTLRNWLHFFPNGVSRAPQAQMPPGPLIEHRGWVHVASWCREQFTLLLRACLHL